MGLTYWVTNELLPFNDVEEMLGEGEVNRMGENKKVCFRHVMCYT